MSSEFTSEVVKELSVSLNLLLWILSIQNYDPQSGKTQDFSIRSNVEKLQAKIPSSLPMQECGNNSDIYNDYRIEWSIITSLLESMGVGLPRYDCKQEWVRGD